MERLNKTVSEEELGLIVANARLGVYADATKKRARPVGWSYVIDVLEAHFGMSEWQLGWSSQERRVALNRLHTKLFGGPGPWREDEIDGARHERNAQVEV